MEKNDSPKPKFPFSRSRLYQMKVFVPLLRKLVFSGYRKMFLSIIFRYNFFWILLRINQLNKIRYVCEIWFSYFIFQSPKIPFLRQTGQTVLFILFSVHRQGIYNSLPMLLSTWLSQIGILSTYCLNVAMCIVRLELLWQQKSFSFCSRRLAF